MTKFYLDINESRRRHVDIPGLDGVRAISILIVMVSHSGLENQVPGVLGVTIFFFLSGFLITTLLHNEYRETGGIDIKKFYTRRFLRLYPPLAVYIVAVIVTLIFLKKDIDGIGLLGALFYFANYLFALAPYHIVSFGVHLWSLSVEEHFYIFFPLLMLLLVRRRVQIVPVLTLLCFIPLFARIAIVLLTDPSHFVTYTTVATECRFDSILFGCLTAMATRQAWAPRFILVATHPATVVIAFALMLLTLVDRNTIFRQTLRFTIQNFALISLLLTAVYTSRFIFAKRLLNSVVSRWIGVLSYSLYLWHFATFASARYLLGPVSPAIIYLTGWVASFIVALAVHFFVERPIFEARRRFGSHAHESVIGVAHR